MKKKLLNISGKIDIDKYDLNKKYLLKLIKNLRIGMN